MHIWSCSKYLTSAYSARLNYIAEKSQVKIATRYRTSYAFLSLFINSCTSVNYPCEFIQSDVPSSTLLLPIPNEFGTLFELGVQRLETLEELEIQYSQALAKCTFTTCIVFCLLPFLYRFFIFFIVSLSQNRNTKNTKEKKKKEREPILRLACRLRLGRVTSILMLFNSQFYWLTYC